MPDAIRVERNGPIGTVILHRPAVRNAVDPPTALALAQACLSLDCDPDIRVLVLWGEGGTFCAGADLGAVSRGWDPSGPQVPTGAPDDALGPMGVSRLELGKPVIAAIAGHAVAGGLEIALWCDLRVAEEDATLGVFCRRWGVPLIDGGTFRLPRLVGEGRALDLILTGRAVGASEALAMGLVNRVVPRGESRLAAETLALEIASFPQACLRADRASCREHWDRDRVEALRNEFARGLDVLNSGESAQGAARFVGGAGRGGQTVD
jgi:enoyl-CoA hydratase